MGKAVKRQYGEMGRFARYYDLIMALMTFGREKKLRQMEVRLANLMPGDKVLEIGCGTGTLSLAAKAQVGTIGEVAGLDIAPEMIAVASRKAARTNADVSFRIGSIASIPFPDNRFDAVMCSFMIFHMPDDIRRKGFTEIYRVLKAGGHLFVVEQALPHWQRRFLKTHDIRELAPVLKENSFTEIEVEKTSAMSLWFLRAKAQKA